MPQVPRPTILEPAAALPARNDPLSDENPYTSPSSVRPSVLDAGWQSLLFSFAGRVPRRAFWGLPIAGFVVYLASVYLVMLVFGPAVLLTYLVLCGGFLLFVWVSLALGIKRWHDRGRSGWWILTNFVPIVGWIWAFVEQGCLRGTVGPNDFGPDPT